MTDPLPTGKPPEQPKGLDNVRQVFRSRFSCYADTTDDSVVMAMDEDRFVEVVTRLMELAGEEGAAMAAEKARGRFVELHAEVARLAGERDEAREQEAAAKMMAHGYNLSIQDRAK